MCVAGVRRRCQSIACALDPALLVLLKVCAQTIYGASLRIGKTFRRQQASLRSKNNQLLSIHIVRAMTMTWMQALKEYNKAKSVWCMPRRGTADHAHVKAMMRGEESSPASASALTQIQNTYSSSIEVYQAYGAAG